MSSYDSSTTTFTAVPAATNAELIRTALSQHLGGQMRAWVGSADLCRLADSARLGDSGDANIDRQAQALQERLVAQPTAHAMVATAQPTLLAESASLLERSQEHRRLGDVTGAQQAAREAHRTLRSAIDATATRLAVDERTLTTEATGRSLRRLGFDVVSEATGERSAALWAVRGDQAVAVLVQDGGAVETDVIGCPGDTCEPPMAQFRQAMADDGVVLDFAARSSHGSTDGGNLVARARATDADSVAAGLVQQLERPARRRTTRPTTTTRTPLRTEETN